MNASRFRLLLAASLVLGLLAAFIDQALPQLLPTAFRDVNAAQQAAAAEQPMAWYMLVLAVLCIGGLIATVYGLFRFRRWAPWLAVAGSALTVFVTPVMGPLAQSGLAMGLGYASSYLWGAVLVLCFVPPIRPLFARREALLA